MTLFFFILNYNSCFVFNPIEGNKYDEKFLKTLQILMKCRRVAPYTPTRSCVHIGVMKKKIKSKKKIKKNKE